MIHSIMDESPWAPFGAGFSLAETGLVPTVPENLSTSACMFAIRAALSIPAAGPLCIEDYSEFHLIASLRKGCFGDYE